MATVTLAYTPSFYGPGYYTGSTGSVIWYHMFVVIVATTWDLPLEGQTIEIVLEIPCCGLV
jgi:hypothetical protein